MAITNKNNGKYKGIRLLFICKKISKLKSYNYTSYLNFVYVVFHTIYKINFYLLNYIFSILKPVSKTIFI